MDGSEKKWWNRLYRDRFPKSAKIAYALFLCILVPVYWRAYGPANFIWGSDIALFVTFAALVLESPLLASMMAVGVLPFEIAWALDFISGSWLLGTVDYMFEPDRPLHLKALSLYHLGLPVVLVLLLRRLGYDRRALVAQTLLVWLVLPLTYLLTDPIDNVNFVFGPGKEVLTVLHPLVYLALEMGALPLLVYLPMHLLLRRLFRQP